MLSEYIAAAMRHALVERLADGSYFGRITGFDGVWASAAAAEECRTELREVLEDWLVVGLRLGHELPVVDGLDLNAKHVA